MSNNDSILAELHERWLDPPPDDEEDISWDECDICGATVDVSDTTYGRLCMSCELNQEEW